MVNFRWIVYLQGITLIDGKLCLKYKRIVQSFKRAFLIVSPYWHIGCAITLKVYIFCSMRKTYLWELWIFSRRIFSAIDIIVWITFCDFSGTAKMEKTWNKIDSQEDFTISTSRSAWYLGDLLQQWISLRSGVGHCNDSCFNWRI